MKPVKLDPVILTIGFAFLYLPILILVVYSFSISVTQSCGPCRPACTARWVIEQTFDVEWLCSAFEAATTSFGASVQPQRQPVIA